MALDDRTAVILVNYRGSQDTLECLASLFSGETTPWVIVVDNESGDGSVERIAAWAENRCDTPIADPHHQRAAYGDIARPIDYEILGPERLAQGVRKPLTIIESGANLGFAGGNNHGLRLALANPGVDLFWLLNNDTVIEPCTARALRAGFEAHPAWGMAGSPLRLYYRPDTHQLVNGMRFTPFTATAAGIGAGVPVDRAFDADDVIRATDFVSGASTAVTRPFLEEVGLMEEAFFLYYEEIDWALRAKGKFAIGFIPGAIVYHKEGASAGSASRLSSRARSPLSEYHHIRSKMLFGRKHFPALLPTYFLQNLVIFLRRIARRQPDQAKAVWRATFGLPWESPRR